MNQTRGFADLAPQPQYEPGTRTTDYEDLMHGPGELVVDEFLDPDPDAPKPSHKFAGLLDRTIPGRFYFFSYNRYVVVDVNPYTNDNTIVWGPKLFIEDWPSLLRVNFGEVDAVLPNPKNKNESYMFLYDKVALLHFQPDFRGNNNDYVVQGPTLISQNWPVSLTAVGFDTVDAVLPNPTDDSQAYFFSDTMYALLKIHRGSDDDGIIRGPTPITEGWPSIKEAGFDRLDTVLPNPSVKHEAYFFRGKECVLVNVTENGKDDFIVSGPHVAADVWPSLAQARIYSRPW